MPENAIQKKHGTARKIISSNVKYMQFLKGFVKLQKYANPLTWSIAGVCVWNALYHPLNPCVLQGSGTNSLFYYFFSFAHQEQKLPPLAHTARREVSPS